jgi:predicted RNA binding protein YcfA (HicA-like mRNA interferase family)
MGRKNPPLKPSDCVTIVEALGFKFDRQKGSHAHYERAADPKTGRLRAVVTIDMSVDEFGPDLLASMCRQSQHTKKEWYAVFYR